MENNYSLNLNHEGDGSFDGVLLARDEELLQNGVNPIQNNSQSVFTTDQTSSTSSFKLVTDSVADNYSEMCTSVDQSKSLDDKVRNRKCDLKTLSIASKFVLEHDISRAVKSENDASVKGIEGSFVCKLEIVDDSTFIEERNVEDIECSGVQFLTSEVIVKPDPEGNETLHAPLYGSSTDSSKAEKEFDDYHIDGDKSARRVSHCNATFVYKSHLKDHIRARISSHIKTHTGKKPFSCIFCSATFARKTFLMKHIKTHTGEEPISCTYCNASFPHKQSLNDLIKTHPRNKPFNCAYCNKNFLVKCGLLLHIRTHTGEKPFSCSHCGAVFTRKDYLKDHLRTHTGERPFICSHCSARFPNKTRLSRHIRIHTGERPFSCTSCNASFARKDKLNYHIETHNPEKPLSCSLLEYEVHSCHVFP